MPEDDYSIALAKALETLDPVMRVKAAVARNRFELRQLRLQRLKLESEKKRAQQLLDPVARALAKAKTLAKQQAT